jgi:UDP-GlcNAc:undecaprenyl-phosphate/decaprenyl-phosphate GlcNAc-1-phosphate transferase
MTPYSLPLAAFLICLVLTPLVKKIASSKGWMAYPVKDRWHRRPTALMGGIAIYIGFCLPVFLLVDFSSLSPLFNFEGAAVKPSISAITWIGASLLFILGILDDFLHIKPHTKLIGQIVVAAIVVFAGYRLQWFTSLTLDTMVTLFWIIGITNAFNLIDNMDGLCAGTGAVAAIFFAAVLWRGPAEAPGLALCLAGSLAAFLFYNFNPASIFMGDCGSLVIGFTVSMLGLYYAEGAKSAMPSLAVPITIVMVPILDTTLVTLVRILSGRKASTGGKDHTSHRLVLMGLTERAAVVFLWGIGAVSGITGLFVSHSDSFTSPGVLTPLLVSLGLMAVYLSQLRVYPEKEFSLLRDKTFTPVLVELTYKRQIVLVVLDFGLMAFCYYLSWRLRFDSVAFKYYFNVFLRSLPAVIICKLCAYFIVGVYRNIWGHMSSDEVGTYLKAGLLGTLLSVAAVTYIYRFEDFSKGIFVIDWLLATGALLATRGFFRLSGDLMKRRTLRGDKVLIYGAGRGGELLLREILNNPDLKLNPVGFIDDDPLKNGKKLQGYPVLGSFQETRLLASRHEVSTLLISFRPENPERMMAIKGFCRKSGLILKQFTICVLPVNLEEE